MFHIFLHHGFQTVSTADQSKNSTPQAPTTCKNQYLETDTFPSRHSTTAAAIVPTRSTKPALVYHRATLGNVIHTLDCLYFGQASS